MILDSGKFTKEEAIQEHRKMWNWIADETLKQKRIVTKRDYMNLIMKKDPDRYTEDFICSFIKHSYCFLCLYTSDILKEKGLSSCYEQCVCPLVWHNENTCVHELSPFNEWNRIACEDTPKQYSQKECEYMSKLARKIANLPERKE